LQDTKEVDETMFCQRRREWIMSAIEVIATALAAGAGAGATDTASAAVRDAYDGLKRLLKERFTGHPEAVQALLADETERGTWEIRIGRALAASGADRDEQVIAAARHLLAAADPEKAKAFHIVVGRNYGAVGGEFSGSLTFHQLPSDPPSSPAAG
jgi:hypothetical protein